MYMRPVAGAFEYWNCIMLADVMHPEVGVQVIVPLLPDLVVTLVKVPVQLVPLSLNPKKHFARAAVIVSLDITGDSHGRVSATARVGAKGIEPVS